MLSDSTPIHRLVDAPDSDFFDVLSRVMYTTAHKICSDRADGVRAASVGDASGETQNLLLSILSANELGGESELAAKKLGSFLTVCFGSLSEGKAKLGGLAASTYPFTLAYPCGETVHNILARKS